MAIHLAKAKTLQAQQLSKGDTFRLEKEWAGYFFVRTDSKPNKDGYPCVRNDGTMHDFNAGQEVILIRVEAKITDVEK